MTEPASTQTPAAIQAAAQNLGRDMLDTLMQQIEHIVGWSMTSQQTRDAAVARLKESVEKTIRQCIAIIGAGSFPACGGQLSSVRFGKSISVSIDVDRKAPGRHELIDMAGMDVVILMANPQDYTSRMADIKASTTQPDLFDPDYQGIPETDGEVRASESMVPHTHLCLCGHPRNVHTDENGCEGADLEGAECLCIEFEEGAVATSDNQDAPAVTVGNTPDVAEGLAPADSHTPIGDLRTVLAGTLAQIDILITADQVEKLTDAQVRAAYEYAVRKTDYPNTSHPKPHYLPDPTPGS